MGAVVDYGLIPAISIATNYRKDIDMKKRKCSLGTVVRDRIDPQSYTIFFTPYLRVSKANRLFSLLIFVIGAICSFVPSAPSFLITCCLILFTASWIVGIFWFDDHDHRVYVADHEIIVKVKGTARRYKWSNIKTATMLPENVIDIEFVDHSHAHLKNFKAVDELMTALSGHMISRAEDN